MGVAALHSSADRLHYQLLRKCTGALQYHEQDYVTYLHCSTYIHKHICDCYVHEANISLVFSSVTDSQPVSNGIGSGVYTVSTLCCLHPGMTHPRPASLLEQLHVLCVKIPVRCIYITTKVVGISNVYCIHMYVCHSETV